MGRRAALWGLACYGLGSPALIYAREDWAQPLSGLCALGALLAALHLRRGGGNGALALCAVALGYAVLTRPVEGILLVPGILLIALPGRRADRGPAATLRIVGALGLALALAIAATLLVNRARNGAWLATGYGEAEGWTTPLWIGLPGALLSPGRGLLLSFPAILLAPLGARRLWRGGAAGQPAPSAEGRVVAAALLLTSGLLLLNTATWYAWWGAFCWGLRLFVPALPLVAVLAAAGVAALPARARRWLPGLLLAAGLLWAAPAVVASVNASIDGGYLDRHNTSASQFRLDAYPPLGVGVPFRRLRAEGFADPDAADIVWLRAARASANLALAPPLLAVLTAALLAGAARRRLNARAPTVPTRR